MKDLGISIDHERIKRIRAHMQRTEKQAQLLQSHKKWFFLMTSIQTLEDTACAIDYYTVTPFPKDMRGKYLYVYGLLQALFVQLDAVNMLYKSLYGKTQEFGVDYPKAYKVREIRNDVIGHPTNRGNRYTIELIQSTMNKSGFSYYKYDLSNPGALVYSEHYVDIGASISDISQCVNDILDKINYELNTEFADYINHFKEIKMKEIFTGLTYAEEKCLLDDVLSSAGYNSLTNMVSAFEEQLVQRYGSAEAIDASYDKLTSIHEIQDILENKLQLVDSSIRETVKKQLLRIMFKDIEDLEKQAEEIDEYFIRNGAYFDSSDCH